MQHINENEQVGVLNGAIEQRFSKPNRWGYSIYRYPWIAAVGLTYGLSYNVILKGQRYTSVDEVEKLFTDIYIDGLEQLNSIRTIRPFLADFPLTPPSVILCLGFRDERGEHLPPPYISSTILEREKLFFSQFVVGKEYQFDFAYKDIAEKNPKEIPGLKELYSPSIPRRKADVCPQIVTMVPPSLPEEKAMFGFLKGFSKTNNLELLTIGRVGDTIRDIWPFEFALCGKQQLKLDEARKLAARCVKEFGKFVGGDSRCIAYLKKRSTLPRFKDEVTVPEPRHFAFRISFWDENIDRQAEPYIAEIRYFGGTFKYFAADENQRLVLVLTETLDKLASP